MVMPYDVWFHEGEGAPRRLASLAPEGSTFRVVAADRTSEAIPFADLIRRADEDGNASFMRRGRAGWRLIFAGGVPASLAAQLPARRWSRIVSWAAIAIVVLATLVVFALRTT